MRSFKLTNYRMDLPELLYLGLSMLLLSFFYVFDDVFKTWSQVFINFLNVLVIMCLSLLFHEFVKKTIAQSFGISSTYNLWIPGFFISVITSIFSEGKLLLFTYGFSKFKQFYGAKLGKSRVSIREDERGVIILSGVLASLALALLVKLLAPFLSESVWLLGVNVNLWIALFALIPFPPLNGTYLLLWSRVVWVFSVIACLALGFLLPSVSIVWSLLVMVGLCASAFFLMKSS